MARADISRRHHGAPVADMNVVPLVDVMLVLLVIFIVTAPLLTHAVKIDLPRAASAANITRPTHIEFGIREDGKLFWNGEPVPLAELATRFGAEAQRQPQPELHLRADRKARYESVAQVMALAARAGLLRIGFVSTPEEYAAARACPLPRQESALAERRLRRTARQNLTRGQTMSISSSLR
ncbi:MAG: biopolymer transporter ExbD [Rhodocyclales bacterium]|nr:biopolymer transporter ExbD [Rhodocyclales bacterium]